MMIGRLKRLLGSRSPTCLFGIHKVDPNELSWPEPNPRMELWFHCGWCQKHIETVEIEGFWFAGCG